MIPTGPLEDTWRSVQTLHWTELQTALRTRKATHWPKGRKQSSQEQTSDWNGGLSWRETLDMVDGRTPWVEGRERIEQSAREQAGKHVLKRPLWDYGYDVTGADYDIGAVLEGRPEHWVMPVATGVGDPGVIRLLVAMSTSASVEPDVIFDRIAAVGAAALTLEACGSAVEIYAAHHSPVVKLDARAAGYCHVVRLNAAGEPLDTTRLATLAHPSFHRRGMFRLIECSPSPLVTSYWAGSYGMPEALTPEHAAQLFGLRSVYIPPANAANPVAPTVEALMALVKAKIGVKGTDDYVD